LEQRKEEDILSVRIDIPGSPDPYLFHFGIKASLFAFLCLVGSHAHRECDISHGMAEVEGFPARRDFIVFHADVDIFSVVFADINTGVASLVFAQPDLQKLYARGGLFLAYGDGWRTQTGDGFDGGGRCDCPIFGIGKYFVIVGFVWLCFLVRKGALCQ